MLAVAPSVSRGRPLHGVVLLHCGRHTVQRTELVAATGPCRLGSSSRLGARTRRRRDPGTHLQEPSRTLPHAPRKCSVTSTGETDSLGSDELSRIRQAGIQVSSDEVVMCLPARSVDGRHPPAADLVVGAATDISSGWWQATW